MKGFQNRRESKMFAKTWCKKRYDGQQLILTKQR